MFGMTSLVAGETIAAWTFNGATSVNVPAFHAAPANATLSQNAFGEGLVGKALATENGRNMLKVPHHDRLGLVNDFTIRCIFNPKQISSYRTIIWKGNRNVDPQQINYYLSLRDGKPEFKFKNAGGEWIVATSDKALVKPEQWYLLTVTMDAQGEIKGYLNGTPCFKMKYVPAKLTLNCGPVFIGGGQSTDGSPNYSFDGLIEEVTIMSGVVPPTEAEVKEFNRKQAPYNERQEEKLKQQKAAIIKEITADGDKDVPAPELLGKMDLAALGKVRNQADYRRLFRRCAAGNPVMLSVLPTAKRIVNLDDYATGRLALTAQIELSAARNESEGFQIILMGNPTRETSGIKVDISDLWSADGQNVIPIGKLEWGYIKSIKSDKPEYPVDFVGDYPDPIMEGQSNTVTVPAGGFTPVYVRIGVDRDVKPGNYSGCIKIIADGQEQTVDVKLKVYDFTLPVTTSCKVVFSFFEGFYAEWYGYKTLSDEQKMAIYDFLLKYRITPNNIYTTDIYPELKFMPELKKKGANFCTLGYLNGKKKLSDEELKQLLETYRQRIDAVKKAGFADMTYLYAFDELHWQTQGEKEAAKQIMPAFKAAFPEIKSIQTSYPYPDIVNLFDLWVPQFQSFDNKLDEIKKLSKNGKNFWWYAADTPIKPYPNFFLDYPVLDHRLIFTLSYKYNLDGVLYWCINREWSTNYDIKGQWPEKNWKPYIINCFNQQRQYKNGMGNYVYPGKDGRILPSLRLENLRDGIEDYEYLTMLKKRVEELKKRQPESKIIAEAEKLLTVPPAVAKSVREYSADPEHLQQYRNAVAEMIVKLGRQ